MADRDADAAAATAVSEDETITLEVEDEVEAEAGASDFNDLDDDDDDVFIISFPAKDSLFAALLSALYDLHLEGLDVNNDTYVRCSDGVVHAPSILLAAVSPVFRVAGGEVAPDAPSYSLILPDVRKQDLETFLLHLCQFHSEETDPLVQDMEAIERVMNYLCPELKRSVEPMGSLLVLDQDWNQMSSDDAVKKKKKTARKRTKQVPGPYVKMEVLETPRQETTYGLRQRISRKRFADEVSDPSDLDDSENEDISSEEASDYEPEDWDVQEEEEEMEEDEDDESDEEEDLEEDTGSKMPDGDEDGLDEDESEFMAMFTVRLGEDGQVEVLNARDHRDNGSVIDTETLSTGGIGRIVSVMEGEQEIAFQGAKLVPEKLPAASSNPRSLLKPNLASSSESTSLLLFCSVCEAQFSDMSELRHHVAKSHKGSKFFLLPLTNPHRNCLACETLMKSYEELIAEDGEITRRKVCFPCPHCRRRYVGRLGSLANHLLNDHRNVTENSSGVVVMHADDANVLRCEFCEVTFTNVQSVNRHLISCQKNTSGHSAGLNCIICGKMFAQDRHLKDHLQRHGSETLARDRLFACSQCAVTCVSEIKLQKHIDKEHGPQEKDQSFTLHDGCKRCEALFQSYLDNKTTNAVPLRHLAFKCPHCCMVLYAHQKHAPRYLLNHLNKFHMDHDVNDFTLGNADAAFFRVLSKTDTETLRCEFCNHQSSSRCNHNAHLSVCKASTVPCRPGYMCDSCGYIGGTSRHLREHLETHAQEDHVACDHCNYTTRSARNLRIHVRKAHSARITVSREPTQRKRKKRQQESTGAIAFVECPKCGKEKREGASLKNHLKKCGRGPARVKCTGCEMEFKRKEDMQAHALIHYGQVTCPIHNILFKQEVEVFQHVNQAEVGDKVPRLQCCMCDAHFRHMCHFMKHIRRHLKIQPYRCGLCQKHFNTFASLQVHQQNIHGAIVGPKKLSSVATADKLFHCVLCSKSFNTKGHLKEHVLGVHDRGNTVTCPVCQKSFTTHKRMKKHLFNSHKDMAEQFRSHSKVEVFNDTTCIIMPD